MDEVVISEDVYKYMNIVDDLGSLGVCLNVVFQTITIILVFWYIYYALRKYYCFRISMLLAVFPAYINKISTVNYYNISVLVLTLLIIALLVVYGKISAVSAKKKKNIGNEENSSMREIEMAEIENKQVKMLDNPLPVPKRREHREMEFAIELTPENDDFDIKELPEGDDFDIE
jgi:hypothetical protein